MTLLEKILMGLIIVTIVATIAIPFIPNFLLTLG